MATLARPPLLFLLSLEREALTRRRRRTRWRRAAKRERRKKEEGSFVFVFRGEEEEGNGREKRTSNGRKMVRKCGEIFASEDRHKTLRPFRIV